MEIGAAKVRRVSLFYSYSRRDERFLGSLKTHLAVLRRSGLIAEWHDREICAGSDWRGEIDRNLAEADIVLLLVSPDFLASDYCWGEEMTKALDRHERGEARVIPVILRPCRWRNTPLARLQAVPRDGKPVTDWPNRDVAFDHVAAAIERIIEDQLEERCRAVKESNRKTEQERRRREQEAAEGQRRAAEEERQRREREAAEARQQAHEEERQRREQEAAEAKRRAAEEERQRREQEAAEAKCQAEEEERQRREQEAAEAKCQAEEEERQRREQEAAEAKRRAAEEERQRREQEAAEAKCQAEEEERQRREQAAEARRRAEEEERQRREQEAAEARRRAEEEERQRREQAAEVKRRAEAEAKAEIETSEDAAKPGREWRGGTSRRWLTIGALVTFVAAVIGIVLASQKPGKDTGEPALKPGDTFADCAECPEMVVIPGGTFLMGSPESEQDRENDEGPQRQVTIKPFAIGKYEVTFEEWGSCVAAGGCNDYRPSDYGWGRDSRPVINVSWRDAQAYVDWLAEKTNSAYRLPTEAEWEYAARATTTKPFSFGETITTQQANYNGNNTYGGGSKGEYRQQTVFVGSLPANSWGLHEIHGNVWEWVEDCYHNSYQGAPPDGAAWIHELCSSRVLRGGSWYSPPRDLRSANRVRYEPHNRLLDVVPDIGFRVAKTID